jgi:hypothetical protein
LEVIFLDGLDEFPVSYAQNQLKIEIFGNTALKTYQTHRAKVLPSRCLSVAQRLGAG